jgi:hypothetical protein
MIRTQFPGRTSRDRARRAARGVSLFEAKLLVAAVAVALGGGTIYFSSRTADDKVQLSKKDAHIILDAARDHLLEDGLGCPTVTSLKRDHRLEPSAAASDAWGGRFRVLCSGDELKVLSAGPDGRMDSKDDVRASRSRS